MGWEGLAGQALGLVDTILKFIGDQRVFKKKDHYKKFLAEIEELRNLPDEEKDDNLLDYKLTELTDFLRVWSTELKSQGLEK